MPPNRELRDAGPVVDAGNAVLSSSQQQQQQLPGQCCSAARAAENIKPKADGRGWLVRADSSARRSSQALPSVPAPAARLAAASVAVPPPVVARTATVPIPKTTTLPTRPLVQRAAAGPTGKGKPCPVCKSAEAVNPWRGPCGHQACYTCWLQALSAMKCPSCSAPTRKRQLTKVFFG